MTRLGIEYSPVSRCLALALAAGLWTVGGCGGSSSGDGNDAGGTPDAGNPGADSGSGMTGPTGTVQFIHAAPAVGALALYVRGQATPIMPFALYSAVKAQLKAPAGMVQFEVRPEGAPAATSPLYTSPAVSLAETGSLTVLAVGVLPTDANTASPPEQAFRLLVLSDATSRPASGKARLHVVNAMYSSPVDVDLGDDGTVEIAALARLTASETPIEVTAGDDLAVGITGILSPAPAARIGAITVAGASLGDGDDGYLVITGLATVPPRDARGTLVMWTPSNGKRAAVLVRPDPVIYVLAASPDASGLDVNLGATKLGAGLAFGQIASRGLRPSPTGYTLDIRPAGAAPSRAPGASLSTGALDAGQQYLAVISGLTGAIGSDGLALRVYRDDMGDGNEFGRVRVVHACLGADPIDAGRYVSAGTALAWSGVADFQAIAPGAASVAVGTVLEASSTPPPIVLGARRTASPELALRFDRMPVLLATDRVFAVLAGAWNPSGNQLPARYILVKTAATGTWTTSVLSPVPTSLEVTPAAVDLGVGDTLQLVATEMFGNGTTQRVTGVATWTLADTQVATLAARGQVTAKALGVTAVTARLGEVTGTAELHVVPRPAIARTVPGDGISGIDPGTPVAVTFSQPIAPATLVAQTASGACTGTLQLSADGFATCIGFAHAAPDMDASGQVATFQLAAPLGPNTTYRIRVSSQVTSPGGVALASDFTQTTGFNVAVGLAVAATRPVEGAGDVLLTTPIAVTFNRAIAPATLIAQTTAGPCTGTLQLSADGFATCAGFAQAAPAMDAANQVATLQPAVALAGDTIYRIRVLGAVTSAAGVAIGGDFTQVAGFATVSLHPPVVTATAPGDGATRVATAAAIAVTFSAAIAPATLTAQTASGACTGTLQLSADGFATCLAFAQSAPVMDATGHTASFQPKLALVGQTNHRIRVIGAVTSIAGVAMAADFTHATGFRTTCAGRLVISQVFGGGGQAVLRHDFIELHNVGREPADLSGYGLLAALGSSTAWSAQALTSVQIPAGGFFLIQESPGSTVNMALPALPTPDYTPPSPLNINGINAKLALTSANPTSVSGASCASNAVPPITVFDLVGYGNTGTPACAEGNTALAALTTSTAAIRNDNGCRDTNVNASDFGAGAPVPRNGASPAQPCACD